MNDMDFKKFEEMAKKIEEENFEDMDIRGYIENTILKPEATPEEVEGFIKKTLEYRLLGVCVNPAYVSLAKSLASNEIKIVSVVGFPLGATTTYAKIKEAERCVKDGADEIDMVMNVGYLKGKDYRRVEGDIREVVSVGVPVKVIIETCLLNDEEKVVACRISENAGANFVKTSTGFSKGGATIYDVILMKNSCSLKVKASGGIRTKEFAIKLIKAGASRIGTSKGLDIV